ALIVNGLAICVPRTPAGVACCLFTDRFSATMTKPSANLCYCRDTEVQDDERRFSGMFRLDKFTMQIHRWKWRFVNLFDVWIYRATQLDRPIQFDWPYSLAGRGNPPQYV